MNSNEQLVDYLRDRGYIKTDRVEKAFRNVDRADFVPEGQEDRAYSDFPLSIAEGTTISAPHMVAINTELLEVEEGNSAVEVGSGSGYQVAILSELAEEVVGVEIIEILVRKSRERLSGRENVRIVEGDGLKAVEGNYDRILFSCAIDSFEEAEERLKPGGIAVAPVYEDSGQMLKKMKDGEIEQHGRVNFVPRVDSEDQLKAD